MLEPSPAEPDILPTLIKQDANASIEDNHVKLFCKIGPINREGETERQRNYRSTLRRLEVERAPKPLTSMKFIPNNIMQLIIRVEFIYTH